MNQTLWQNDIRSSLPAALPWEKLAGQTLLLTGATGLVGRALADMLAAANRQYGLRLTVYALSRNAARAKELFADRSEIVPVEGDITDESVDLPDADCIIHAASNAHPKAFSLDPVGTMLGNIIGTRTLLEKLRRQGRGRLLFISTGEIYGENPDVQNGFSEDDFGKIDSMSPRACYPESKRAAETLCASYSRQYCVDAVVARLCYVFGPTLTQTNSRADAQFLRNAINGEDIVMKSAGTQLRSYCYAPDAAAALMTVLLKGETATAYNVADRRGARTIRQYAEALARVSGVRLRFEIPEGAEQAGYSKVSRAVQNPARLEALGWQAQFNVEDGISRTFEIITK